MARKPSTAAYWASVVLAIACLAFVVAHHISLNREIEIGGIPLALLAGGGAILAILIHELMDSAAGAQRAAQDRQRESEDQDRRRRPLMWGGPPGPRPTPSSASQAFLATQSRRVKTTIGISASSA